MKNDNDFLRSIWKFLKNDSWVSLVVVLLIAFILIKFIFFPLLSLITGTTLPLVIVESCSMYHSENLANVLENEVYPDYDIYLNSTEDWHFKNGLNKGDIIFVWGVEKEDLKVGDVIIFEGGSRHPIIHRIIDADFPNKITTKGDHNVGLLAREIGIDGDGVIGKAVLRVPMAGWAKLIFFEWGKNPSERGLCR